MESRIIVNKRTHRLAGDNVDRVDSPNHGGKFEPGLPDTIIIHYTAGPSARSAVNTFRNPKAKASAHLVVDRDGSITQMAPFDTVAWHAGKSSYGGRSGFNKYSIGIEIVNAGELKKIGDKYAAWFGRLYAKEEVLEAAHRNDAALSFWHKYTEDQITCVLKLCRLLRDAYSISSILGHEEIAPRRKRDPGPAFPLDHLRLRALERRDEDAPDEIAAPKDGSVSASQLNIRQGPAANTAAVAPPLPRGTKLHILGENNGWYEVEVKTRGWVKKDFVEPLG